MAAKNLNIAAMKTQKRYWWLEGGLLPPKKLPEMFFIGAEAAAGELQATVEVRKSCSMGKNLLPIKVLHCIHARTGGRGPIWGKLCVWKQLWFTGMSRNNSLRIEYNDKQWLDLHESLTITP